MARRSEIGEETWGSIGEALLEVVVITGLSLVPLACIAYYQYVVQDYGFTPKHPNLNHARFIEFMYRNTAAGQLAFYAIANWATVAWLCGSEKSAYPRTRNIHCRVHRRLCLLQRVNRDNGRS